MGVISRFLNLKKPEKFLLTGGGLMWYSIKAVAERHGGQTEKRLEKNEKSS